MDGAFKALAEASRSKLVERLFRRDGQTLGELCQRVAMGYHESSVKRGRRR